MLRVLFRCSPLDDSDERVLLENITDEVCLSQHAGKCLISVSYRSSFSRLPELIIVCTFINERNQLTLAR